MMHRALLSILPYPGLGHPFSIPHAAADSTAALPPDHNPDETMSDSPTVPDGSHEGPRAPAR